MIKDILKSNARRYPNANAIIFKDIRYTFREFNERINSLANALMDMGLRKSDWVAMIADDCIEHVELFWAGAKIGVATSVLNPALLEKDLFHLIGNGKAAAVVCGYKYRNLVDSLRSTLEGVKAILVLAYQTRILWAMRISYRRLRLVSQTLRLMKTIYSTSPIRAGQLASRSRWCTRIKAFLQQP